MAHQELELKLEAKDVAINLDNSRLAVLHSTSFSVLKYEAKLAVLTVDCIEDLPTSDYLVARQICYLGDELLVLMTDLLTNRAVIYNCTSQQETQVSDSENVLRLFSSLSHQSLNLITENEVKKVEMLADSDGIAQTMTITAISAMAPWSEVVHFDDQVRQARR